ncbi:Aste57867_6056 [Aphanomyces stellatus]|uniref:Aste57867_6056 protein n=1 Tax=Aphanomyces stellatus TaxID=120398 RepID=A0A485KEB2_9STRA|nr:hypothetical protein As57867_006042 [Aphanomyces stellatus]VFT83069.1 Aste57867_6056 [Aphanomyces stellatus]
MEGTASDDASSSPSSYIVTFATYAHPHPAFAWWKLAFRVALTLYILRVAYRAYFRPYHQLLVNLRQVGLPPAAVLVDDDDAGVIPTNASIKYPKLVVVMGDPTYFVISHPLVAMVLIVDFWLSTQNFAVATSYVSQVTEWWPFLRGCVYGSKAGWFAYGTMWCASILVKRRHWEHKVASVDAGILGIAVVIYAGPLFYLLANTELSALFHIIWSIWVPPSDQMTTIETLPGGLSAVFLVGSFPLAYSLALVWFTRESEARPWKPFAGSRAKDRRDATAIPPIDFASFGHNDIKVKLLWLGLSTCLGWKKRRHWWRRHNVNEASRDSTTSSSPPPSSLMPSSTKATGGNLHRVFHQDVRYKALPLFSLRAADCFVIGYDANGDMAITMRLSHLGGLDRRVGDMDCSAIRLCPIEHDQSSVGTLNHRRCVGTDAIGPEDPTMAKCLWLHLGADHCQWTQ